MLQEFFSNPRSQEKVFSLFLNKKLELVEIVLILQ